MSSDDCGTDYDNISDCGPNAGGIEFAYSAQDADGIEEMYDQIISSIMDVRMSSTATLMLSPHDVLVWRESPTRRWMSAMSVRMLARTLLTSRCATPTSSMASILMR
jgi:hypothetical protein